MTNYAKLFFTHEISSHSDKQGLASSDKYECRLAGTTSHTVNEWPLTKLSDGGLQTLHLAEDDIVNWLE